MRLAFFVAIPILGKVERRGPAALPSYRLVLSGAQYTSLTYLCQHIVVIFFSNAIECVFSDTTLTFK